jgi:hypothetical protein
VEFLEDGLDVEGFSRLSSILVHLTARHAHEARRQERITSILGCAAKMQIKK